MIQQNETFLRVDQGTVQLVQQSILKTFSLEQLTDKLVENSGVRTPVLPAGCVFYANSAEGVETFIMEKPPGFLRLKYDVRIPYDEDEDEEVEDIMGSAVMDQIEEQLDMDFSDLEVEDGRMVKLRLLFPPLYMVLKRNATSGAISEIRSFVTPGTRLASLDDNIYGSNLPNANAVFGVFCLGSTPKVQISKEPQAIHDVLSNFWGSTFNSDLDGANTPKSLYQRVERVCNNVNVNYADVAMLVYHTVSKDPNFVEVINDPKEFLELGILRELLNH